MRGTAQLNAVCRSCLRPSLPPLSPWLPVKVPGSKDLPSAPTKERMQRWAATRAIAAATEIDVLRFASRPWASRCLVAANR